MAYRLIGAERGSVGGVVGEGGGSAAKVKSDLCRHCKLHVLSCTLLNWHCRPSSCIPQICLAGSSSKHAIGYLDNSVQYTTVKYSADIENISTFRRQDFRMTKLTPKNIIQPTPQIKYK